MQERALQLPYSEMMDLLTPYAVKLCRILYSRYMQGLALVMAKDIIFQVFESSDYQSYYSTLEELKIKGIIVGDMFFENYISHGLTTTDLNFYIMLTQKGKKYIEQGIFMPYVFKESTTQFHLLKWPGPGHSPKTPDGILGGN